MVGPEDLTDADALFKAFLTELRTQTDLQRARLEAFAHGEAPQEADGLPLFRQKVEGDPKKLMAELALLQFATAQAFAVLLADNNRTLLQLMRQG